MKTNSTTQDKTIHIGLDLHCATTVLAAVDGKGKLRHLERFPTSGKLLVDHVAAVRGAPKLLALEETPLSHWAVGLLRPVCDEVVSCCAKHNRWIARNATKRDEVDAERLARLLRLGELKEVYHTRHEDRFAFRAAVQHYLDVQRDRVRAKNKAHALLKRVGLPHLPAAQVFSPKYRKVILDLVPEGNWRSAFRRLLRHYDWLDEEAKEALKELEAFGRRYPEIARFRKIPGVGPVTAHAVSGFLQTPHRFATKSALYRYAALSITDRSSDGKRLGFQRLERGSGCIEIKRATYHAWLGAVSSPKGNEVKDYYEAVLAANGGQSKKARLTTQRKLLATMWAMWRTGSDYDPESFRYRAGQAKGSKATKKR